MSAAAERLDAAFHALANPTRRAVVERLTRGPAAVSELAEHHDMALPSFLQHVRVLEQDGLVRTAKRGRIRTVRLVPGGLGRAGAWLDAQREVWGRRLDQHDAYVRSLRDEARDA